MAYFSNFPGAIPTQHEPVAKAISYLSENGAKNVGAVGYCWGYKVLASMPGTEKLAAIAGCHPS
jgi:dienelactone hydrolase